MDNPADPSPLAGLEKQAYVMNDVSLALIATGVIGVMLLLAAWGIMEAGKMD
jgi:hypothetical protein